MSTIFNELKLRKLFTYFYNNTFFRSLLLFYSSLMPKMRHQYTKRHGPSPHHPDHHPGIIILFYSFTLDLLLCFLIFSRKSKKWKLITNRKWAERQQPDTYLFHSFTLLLFYSANSKKSFITTTTAPPSPSPSPSPPRSLSANSWISY